MRITHNLTAKHVWLAVVVLLALAAWLAVHFPHNSLWYDEALTTYVATDSWATLWRWCTQVDIQVPFHYAVLRLWTGVLGDGEFALRLLSALCALLTVAAMLALGRRLAGKKLGYIAAILLGTMPGFLWVAYEVRAYALGLALYAWATVFLCAIISDAGRGVCRRRLFVAYALLMLAALYTHYTALGGFAAHTAVVTILALARRSWLLARALAIIVVLVGIGFAPWLPVLLTRGAADRSYYTGTPITPARAAEVMLGFKLLGRDDAPNAILPFVVGYATLIALGALLGWASGRRRAALIGIMAALWPVAIVAALVYFKPKLAGRYAWPAWIGFDLLAALAILALASRRRTAAAAFLVFAALIVAPWLTGQRGYPPASDFRGAFAYLCTQGDPADVITLRDGTLFVIARYYGRRPPCTSERYAVRLPEAQMTDVDEVLTLPYTQHQMADIAAHHPPNVWVVSWQGDVMDPQGLAYALLEGTGKHTTQMFGDVRLDRFEQPRPITGDPLASGQPMYVTPVADGPTLETVRLLAPDVAHVSDTVVLETWWRRGKLLQPGLRVSARITTLDGAWIYTQVDQPPAGWKYVDDRWQPDVPALGRYELTIGPDVPPGEFAVRYVLYDAGGLWPPQILTIGKITVR